MFGLAPPRRQFGVERGITEARVINIPHPSTPRSLWWRHLVTGPQNVVNLAVYRPESMVDLCTSNARHACHAFTQPESYNDCTIIFSHVSWPSNCAGPAIILVIQYVRSCAMSSVSWYFFMTYFMLSHPTVPFSVEFCSFSQKLLDLASSHIILHDDSWSFAPYITVHGQAVTEPVYSFVF